MYILLCLILLRKAPKKKTELRDPNKNESYSIISDNILNMIIINLILCALCGLVLAIGITYVAVEILNYLVNLMSYIICISQIYEWVSMILIMKEQKGKDLS